MSELKADATPSPRRRRARSNRRRHRRRSPSIRSLAYGEMTALTACTMPLSTLMSFFLKDTPFTAPPETVMELPAIVVSVFPSMYASVSAPWTARRKRRRGRVALKRVSRS